MPELIRPSMFDRLKICADEIRDRADDYEELMDVRIMARTAVATIMPELREWQGGRLDVFTDMAFYNASPDEPCDRKINGDAFELKGMFSGGALREEITPLDEVSAFSDVELCLRFRPDIQADQLDLLLAPSVLVPVAALRDLRVA